jgi:hypothetical protein
MMISSSSSSTSTSSTSSSNSTMITGMVGAVIAVADDGYLSRALTSAVNVNFEVASHGAPVR